MEEINGKKYMTVKEFAAAMDVKVGSVYSLMNYPNFPKLEVGWKKGEWENNGGKYRICMEDFVKWFTNGGRPVE